VSETQKFSPKKIKWFWKTDDCDEDDHKPVETEDWMGASDAVEAVARYYHSECDGWESQWPVDFSVRKDGTDKWEHFSVHRDYDPTFTAHTRKDEAHAPEA